MSLDLHLIEFIDTSKRENYLFNSTINGIEDSDLIINYWNKSKIRSYNAKCTN